MQGKPGRRFVLWGLFALIAIGLVARVIAGLNTGQQLVGAPFGLTALDAAIVGLFIAGLIFYVLSWVISGSMRRSVAGAASLIGNRGVVAGCAVRVEDVAAIARAGGVISGLVAPKNLAVVLATTSISWWQGRPAKQVAFIESVTEIDYSVDTYLHMGIPYRGLHASLEGPDGMTKLPLVLLRTDTLLPRLVKGKDLDTVLEYIGTLIVGRDSAGGIA